MRKREELHEREGNSMRKREELHEREGNSMRERGGLHEMTSNSMRERRKLHGRERGTPSMGERGELVHCLMAKYVACCRSNQNVALLDVELLVHLCAIWWLLWVCNRFRLCAL